MVQRYNLTTHEKILDHGRCLHLHDISQLLDRHLLRQNDISDAILRLLRFYNRLRLNKCTLTVRILLLGLSSARSVKWIVLRLFSVTVSAMSLLCTS